MSLTIVDIVDKLEERCFVYLVGNAGLVNFLSDWIYHIRRLLVIFQVLVKISDIYK